uniref:Uncharacterized protein n=1 Tax=Glossina pallidipes TaxID=7398 RepID=A0A1B0A4B2_GLOPL
MSCYGDKVITLCDVDVFVSEVVHDLNGSPHDVHDDRDANDDEDDGDASFCRCLLLQSKTANPLSVVEAAKSECEAAKPVAAAAAKCPKCKPGCCSIGGLVAAELEFELGEAGESEPLPLLMLISWLWLEVFDVVTAATCDLEPNILSIVKREAAAAAAVAVLPAAEGRGGRSSSMIVTPDREPSSEDGVCDGDVDSTIFKLCDDRPTFNGGVGGGDGLGVLTTVILNLEEPVVFDSRLPTSWPGELHNDDRILTDEGFS